jgi:hypothetical protein
MTESLFRIQHPLTPQLSALSRRNTGLVLVLANAIIKHDKSGMTWPRAEVWARMMLNVLFAVAEKSAQESGGFALSGNPFEDTLSRSL